ncbi:MAG TPA: site-specific integrase [Solirubrobacteraceae bacterium]
MSDIERPDLQARITVWQSKYSASKVHACVNAARVLWARFRPRYRHPQRAADRPATKGLRLPAVPLEEEDQALWGCAIYAGIRLGELRALRAEKIDFALKRIKIHAGWDQYEGESTLRPKRASARLSSSSYSTTCSSGTSSAPAEPVATSYSAGQRATYSDPAPSTSAHDARGRGHGTARNEESVIPEGERIRAIGLRDSDTAVSHMLDAGITIDKVSKFMGHASITVTIDRYLPDAPEWPTISRHIFVVGLLMGSCRFAAGRWREAAVGDSPDP